MITAIHVTGDYQNEDYAVGKHGVKSIDQSCYCPEPHCYIARITVTKDDGSTVEIDASKLTIYDDGKK